MSWYLSRDLMWVRILGRYGPGIGIARTPRSFNERNGYATYLPLICGWRVILLPRTRAW